MPRRQEDKDEAEEIAQRIGSRARAARDARGLTQEQLAERLSISAEALGRIERGGTLPSFPTFVRLCSALDLKPNDILGGSAPATPPRSKLDPDLQQLLELSRRLGGRQRRVLVSVAREMRVGAKRG